MNLLPDNILKCMSKRDRKSLGKFGLLPSEVDAKTRLKTEKELQQDISSLLRRNDIWFDQDAMCKRRTGTKGTPDFLLSINGKAIAIEAKMPGQKPRLDQQECHAHMAKNGWKVYVVTSIQEVIQILKENL